MASHDASLVTMGFLSIVPHAQHGLFGGYLLLNRRGRPIEFHCSAPVKPSRAQEILFGPTLEAFLYGEHIGQTLVTKAATRPAVIWTDARAALELQPHIDPPVVHVLPKTHDDVDPDASFSVESSGRVARLDPPHASNRIPHVFELAGHRLMLHAEHATRRAAVDASVLALEAGFDLWEPFERIRQAVEEAQRAGR